jgi:xylulokinase
VAGDATFLGLDVGTSSVKALLIDGRQAVCGETSIPLAVSRPRPLWSEQDPAAWWTATQAAIQAIRAAAPQAWRALAGIGLSGQMHGATLLGDGDRVLRPAILWNDGRSYAECEELERLVPDLRRRAANIAMPGFTAPKLLWVKRHEPEVFAATRTVLLPKDYVRLKLTGSRVSDMSDAAGTLWLDVAARAWDDALLAATSLSRRHMPDLVEGSAVSATLLPELARTWGVAAVPVAGGGGDNAASAVGTGAVRAGEGFLSLGTSGVIFAVTDHLAARPDRGLHAFCHALPGRWHAMSVMLSAAASLTWVAELTGQTQSLAGSLAGLLAGLLDRVAARAADPAWCAAAPLFLPYLSGERTPHNDPQATGMFAGLRSEHDAIAVTYAVLEGVAFGFADGLAVMQEAGADLSSCMLVGGGARSVFWAQLLADTLELPLHLPAGAEAGAALGAARLAMLATDAGGEADICVAPPIRRTFVPSTTRGTASAERLARFRALYAAERGVRV